MTVRPRKYQLHKATGQARVRINGHDIYLGKYRSPESEERYRQVIADWLKNQDQVTRQNSARPTGTTTAYSFGDDESQLSKYAWYSGNSGWHGHDASVSGFPAWLLCHSPCGT